MRVAHNSKLKIQNSLLLLLSELGVNLQERRHEERDQAARHHEDEEHLVAHDVLNVARHHARQHQSEIGDAGAYRIM